MGNCTGRGNQEGDAPLYSQVDNEPETKENFEERDRGKSQKDAVVLANNVPDEISLMVTPLRNFDDDNEYYHSDDNISEDHSEWEIIEIQCHTVSGNDRWNHKRAVSLQTLDLHRTRPRSRHSATRVRFSSYEEQQIFDDHKETPSLVTQRNRTDAGISMESVMSNSSVVSAVTPTETVFDNSLLPTRIQIFLSYDRMTWTLRIGVKQLQCSLDPMFENHRVYWQVQITLFPYKMKKRQTRYKQSSNPVFNQAFEVKRIGKSILSDMSARYRVYGKLGRAGRKRLAGEVQVELGSLAKQQGNTILEWRTLRTSRNRLIRRESLE